MNAKEHTTPEVSNAVSSDIGSIGNQGVSLDAYVVSTQSTSLGSAVQDPRVSTNVMADTELEATQQLNFTLQPEKKHFARLRARSCEETGTFHILPY
jgi:hypothetical protein